MVQQKLKGMRGKLNQIAIKAAPYGAAFTLAMAKAMPIIAYAGVDAQTKELMDAIIDIVAKLVIVLGIFFAILGAVHYASANADGDGPAKQKAVMQLASGVMLVLVAVLVSNAGLSDYLVTD